MRLPTQSPKEPLAEQFVARRIQPTLSEMGWGSYSVELTSSCDPKRGTVGVIVLPSGVYDLHLVEGACSTCYETGFYFVGRYGRAAGRTGHLFDSSSLCLRMEAFSLAELLAFALAHLAATAVHSALVISCARSEFFLLERQLGDMRRR